jgi:hypothetical protein
MSNSPRWLATAALIVLVSFATSCASGLLKDYVHAGPDFETRVQSYEKLAIVADVSLMQDVFVGDNYWAVSNSKLAEQYILDGAKSYMANKGYDVIFTGAPFVGGYRDQTLTLRYATEVDGPVQEMHAPLFIAQPAVAGEAQFASATAALAKVQQAIANNSAKKSEPCCSGPEEKRGLAALTHAAPEADAVLFIFGDGLVVPRSKAFAQAVATAAVTLVLTLGMFVYARWDISSMDTWAALLDAKTGELLWSNSLRLTNVDLNQQDFYSRQWTNSVLHHVPARALATDK